MKLPEPITRKEMYLSYLNGNTALKLPEPITRTDIYLYSLCINGGGSGGGGTEYALKSEAGYSLVMDVDPDTYVVEIKLKNKAGDVLSSQDFDFPIETAFVDVDFNEDTNEITFTLQNGTTTDPIDISHIVRGLVPSDRTIAGLDLKDDITVLELANALGLDDKLDKTGDASNVTTKFTEASTRQDLVSGEKLSESMGKIAKNLGDLNSDVAWLGKRAVVCNMGTTKPWFKFASAILPKMYQDYTISFKASSALISNRYFGILVANVRTIPSGVANPALIWEYASSNVNLDDFVLAYKVNDDDIAVELWCKIDVFAETWDFEVLIENKMYGHEDLWTLYNQVSDGYADEITPGYTQVPSTLMTLANDIDGAAGYLTSHEIAKNADLDFILNLGIYHCLLDATATTLKNCPTKYAFSMSVSKSTTFGHVQTIVDNFQNIYSRIVYVNNEGLITNKKDWKQLAFLDDLPLYDTNTKALHDISNITNDSGAVVINSQEGSFIFFAISFVPSDMNGEKDLGDSLRKWKDIYATNGVIQTSDINAKTDIEKLSIEKAKDLIMGIETATYKMKNGTAGRTHWGMLSNDLVNEDGEIEILGIEGLLDKLGWETEDFAGFIKSPHYDIEEYEEEETYYEDEEYEDEDGEIKVRKVPKTRPVKKTREVLVEGKFDYSLRPAEFLPGVIKLVQDHEERIADLEKEGSKQRNEIKSLKKTVNEQAEQIKELKEMVLHLLENQNGSSLL